MISARLFKCCKPNADTVLKCGDIVGSTALAECYHSPDIADSFEAMLRFTTTVFVVLSLLALSSVQGRVEEEEHPEICEGTPLICPVEVSYPLEFTCINIAQFCDGTADCDGGADEGGVDYIDCEGASPQVVCSTGDEMVDISVACDGNSNCADSSDETLDICAYCVVGCYKENRERCCVVDGEVVCGDCLYGYKEVYGKCVKKYDKEDHKKPLPIWLWPLIAGQESSDGRDGEKGQKGWQGRPGDTGAKGVPGDQGPKGYMGLKGLDGFKGGEGDVGDEGQMGEKGETGNPGQNVTNTGVVYTIWGRPVCLLGAGRETIYPGWAASPHHHDSGGGANYMCLPDNPAFASAANTDSEVQTKVAAVKLMTANEPLEPVDGSYLSCAQCYVPQAVGLMIPGQNTCPDDWVLEYAGYLMSAKDTDSTNVDPDEADQHFRSEYICVIEPDDNVGDDIVNEWEAEIYHVHIDCDAGGSLDCDESGPLPCAVCTLPPLDQSEGPTPS